MAKEQIIKTGQITLPRIFFIALTGGLAFLAVTGGDIGLNIGYWGLTLLLSGLLFLVAIDYGIDMEKVEAKSASAQTQTAVEQIVAQPEISEAPRPKRRTSRPAKRRR
jgi:hypothetical protein